jgi:hypothetical protein
MIEVTCQNCQHNLASWFSRKFKINTWLWKCAKSYIPPVYNPVDGSTNSGRYGSCVVVRATEKICGKTAQAWEPRDKKDLFVYLKRI